ncbi:glycosyltransferase family 4 protein [Rhodovastum atsumiense]|uniref:Glycosyltransferase family 4 protein n=2 Tax=Rhodovastum atsumiense TaxID=504468 RepID=A0A5M6J2E5_9PROT|nr:glycosyltransferase family 4 protein [Rhodovastum atsumiense]
MRLAMLLPGALQTASGGHAYDRAIIAGLRALGHDVQVIELAGCHPLPDAAAIASAMAAWDGLAADVLPVIDGRCLPAFHARAEALPGRHAVALLHHPTAPPAEDDTATRARLQDAARDLLPRFARVVVTSEAIADRLPAGFGIDAARLHVVVPGTPDAARSTGSGGPGCEILSVGALVPRKGHDVLLRALSRLPDLEWRLTIVGATGQDPAHARALAALAEQLGIAARVSFAGEPGAEALEALWQGADLFALATRRDGHGMAIAEALRRGLPVAITAGGAAGQRVTPQSGVVCAVEDEATLSKSLRRLIFDVRLRHTVAATAWEVGRALPDWTAQSRAFATAIAP